MGIKEEIKVTDSDESQLMLLSTPERDRKKNLWDYRKRRAKSTSNVPFAVRISSTMQLVNVRILLLAAGIAF